MAYVMPRVLKRGVRYTAIYADENGRYKSAGAYDSRERAQQVAVSPTCGVSVGLARDP
jgi:hypothetical protein